MLLDHALWAEKYRPDNIDDYIFQDKKQKLSFITMIADNAIPNLLLSGPPGGGKSTIAKILINECEFDPVDVLTINASDENNVETIREKIKGFIMTYAMSDYKIVLLEEFDYTTQQFQAILRNMMEQFTDNVRFILTCNYEHKVIPAIKSRCQHFRFKSCDKTEINQLVVEILEKENIKFDVDTVEKIVNVGYPDIRKVINLAQQYSLNGVLLSIDNKDSETSDYTFSLLPLLDKDDWYAIRKLLCATVISEEWDGVYRFLYENLDKSKKFQDRSKWESGIVLIAEHLYKDSVIADREINFASLAIQLSNI